MSTAAILCVDDEAIILESIKEQLRRQFGNRYLYEMAESPQEALEIIDDLYDSEVRVLVIVSDWLMPNMRGDDFLVKVHERYPDIVTIMLTGQADISAIERAKTDANLFACLAKPWSENELISLIKTALQETDEN